MEWIIVNKIYEERGILGEIVNKYEGEKVSYDEDCKENDDDGELRIPSKTCRLQLLGTEGGGNGNDLTP